MNLDESDDDTAFGDVTPNLSGAKFVIGRGTYGPTINLVSLGKAAALTPAETGWLVDPAGVYYKGNRLKPRQIGKLELHIRSLTYEGLPPGAVEAFRGTRSHLKKYENVASVLSVGGVVVSQEFKGRGYGLALYLKALEYASSKGYWMTNDTKAQTSDRAVNTWRALFRYADQKLDGPPAPQRRFDYRDQEDRIGYRGPEVGGRETVITTHRPVLAAFGLNDRGRQALEHMMQPGL